MNHRLEDYEVKLALDVAIFVAAAVVLVAGSFLIRSWVEPAPVSRAPAQMLHLGGQTNNQSGSISHANL
jgi:hypothetical protein